MHQVLTATFYSLMYLHWKYWELVYQAEEHSHNKLSTKEWKTHKESLNTSLNFLTTTDLWTTSLRNATKMFSSTSHSSIKSSLIDEDILLNIWSIFIRLNKFLFLFIWLNLNIFHCPIKIKHPTVKHNYKTYHFKKYESQTQIGP